MPRHFGDRTDGRTVVPAESQEHVFSVRVSRSSLDAPWGIQVIQVEHGVRLEAIKEGPFNEWNAVHPESLVQPKDVIININGCDNKLAMGEELAQATTAILTIVRGGTSTRAPVACCVPGAVPGPPPGPPPPLAAPTPGEYRELNVTRLPNEKWGIDCAKHENVKHEYEIKLIKEGGAIDKCNKLGTEGPVLMCGDYIISVNGSSDSAEAIHEAFMAPGEELKLQIFRPPATISSEPWFLCAPFLQTKLSAEALPAETPPAEMPPMETKPRSLPAETPPVDMLPADNEVRMEVREQESDLEIESFIVRLQRSLDEKWGLNCSHNSVGLGLRIDAIEKDGAVDKFNKLVPEDARFMKGDHIISANGSSKAHAAIDEAIRAAGETLELKVHRPPKPSSVASCASCLPTMAAATITKPVKDRSLGGKIGEHEFWAVLDRSFGGKIGGRFFVGMDGILIQEVHEGGLISEWNKANSGRTDRQFQVGDVIVEADGETTSEAIFERLKSTILLTVRVKTAPQEFTAFLDNGTGAKFGMTTKVDQGQLRVQQVRPGGLAEQWNQKNRDKQIENGDLIVHADGATSTEHILAALSQPRQHTVCFSKSGRERLGVRKIIFDTLP